ncbi:hypothetical protein D9619_004376 [Psilocybe cf. subviscida]|uniref:dolichol kinase n=1 Tax=Psilocybe cf. subviscida TaxID=2480587 RepID=A0A8H5BPI0_9AGAR|nr:hypothetical protein D9619_004376 [Psilocybe cf. subviscida]
MPAKTAILPSPLGSTPSMSSKRGRKRNDNLPPNRARDVQRAFRARRAAHLQALEQRVSELEEENDYLRLALHMPPSQRLPLGKGPTGKDKARTQDTMPFASSRESSAVESPPSRETSASPTEMTVSMSHNGHPMTVIDPNDWEDSMLMNDPHHHPNSSTEAGSSNMAYHISPIPAPLSAPLAVKPLMYPYNHNFSSSSRSVPLYSETPAPYSGPDRAGGSGYGSSCFQLRNEVREEQPRTQYSYPQHSFAAHDSSMHSQSPSPSINHTPHPHAAIVALCQKFRDSRLWGKDFPIYQTHRTLIRTADHPSTCIGLNFCVFTRFRVYIPILDKTRSDYSSKLKAELPDLFADDEEAIYLALRTVMKYHYNRRVKERETLAKLAKEKKKFKNSKERRARRVLLYLEQISIEFSALTTLILVKLPRSHSSPSPPSSKQANGRAKFLQPGQRFRKRVGSGVPAEGIQRNAVVDWSTSYHAGSSSGGSKYSSDEDSDDDTPSDLRGRAFSEKKLQNISTGSRYSSHSVRRRSPHGASSGDSTTTVGPKIRREKRESFTRSRSPALAMLRTSSRRRHLSPSVSRNTRQVSVPHKLRYILSAEIRFQFSLPCTPFAWIFCIDTRRAGENAILLASILMATYNIIRYPTPIIPLMAMEDAHRHLALELCILCATSILYLIWTQTTLSTRSPPTPKEKSPSPQLRPTSPRFPPDGNKRPPPPSRSDFGYIWMSVPKNYRSSRDDGISTGLLLGPLIAASFLYSSIKQVSDASSSTLPSGWRIEPPVTLSTSNLHLSAIHAALLSRYSLVQLSTFCSAIMLIHVCASWVAERWACRGGAKQEGERASVPRSEARRTSYYILFTLGTSAMMIGLKVWMLQNEVTFWKYLNLFEVVIASLFYQLTLYAALRLAHGAFTLGELGLVCFGATALCLETLNITIARIWPVTTSYIRTYRMPTPLLIFQLALIMGSFLVGFLLSPILVLSRNNAQRPVHRLRFPEQKERNRRYYALAFYGGALLIVGTLIGLWTRWCLGNRDPWLWVVFRILEGRKKWTRPALLAYWALLGSISVAGWNRQLARSRRFRGVRTSTSQSQTQAQIQIFTQTQAVDTLQQVPVLNVSTGSGGVSPLIPDGHLSGGEVSAGSTATVGAGVGSSPLLDGNISAGGNTSGGGVAGSVRSMASSTFSTTFPNMPNMPNLPNLPNLPNMPNLSDLPSLPTLAANLPNGKDVTGLLDAADKHVPTLGLNGRRKFFHGLAVVMFVPGVIVDPAFTHLSFSAAFSLFTFAEYVRYFAVYPFGASLHLFMNEFLDHRDGGTAILSHFYLLTGCAGSLWLEGPSRLLQLTGILTLGLGDAAASLVGRRVGLHRWSPTTSKTLEGSLAFALSIFAAVWLLRLFGYVGVFSSAAYLGVLVTSALLEALSDQNDNLTLPLYANGNHSSLHRSMTLHHARKSARPSTAPEGSRLRNSWPTREGVDADPEADDEARNPDPATTPSASMSDNNKLAASVQSEYDWATFITAYAAGHWDPLRTPRLPRSYQQILADSYCLPSFEMKSASSSMLSSAFQTPSSKNQPEQDSAMKPSGSSGISKEAEGDFNAQCEIAAIPELDMRLMDCVGAGEGELDSSSQVEQLSAPEAPEGSTESVKPVAEAVDSKPQPQPPPPDLQSYPLQQPAGQLALEGNSLVERPRETDEPPSADHTDNEQPSDSQSVPFAEPPRSTPSQEVQHPTPPSGYPAVNGSNPLAPNHMPPDSTQQGQSDVVSATVSPSKQQFPPQTSPQSHSTPHSGHARTGRPVNGLTISSTGPMKTHPGIPLRLPLPTHRFKPGISPGMPGSQLSPPVAPSDVHTTVATMRWAAARVDISPLALPSPEHELTDPMRGVVAALPGNSVDLTTAEWQPITPGGTRRSRFSDFWDGTTDVQEISKKKRQLSALISNAPTTDEEESATTTDHTLPNADDPPQQYRPVPPASAPIYSFHHRRDDVSTDYFGDAVARSTAKAGMPPTIPEHDTEQEGPMTPTSSSCSTTTNTAPESATSRATTVTPPAAVFLAVRDSRILASTQLESTSVPAMPRRVSLTRQTSSPFPETSTSLDPAWFVGKGFADYSAGSGGRSLATLRLGRAAKEEQMFNELGYLAPPNPPEELDRRRALNKFNIWNTGADINFDRIAHLAKLVFSTKGVIISLIDGNDQWCKSQWGLSTNGSPREHSFCGHAILQRGDEPMIILDAQNDWRFKNNPMVTGAPNIRFYAGAPLRTTEGFNIGALAVIDDNPREEFTPRQRHTLKEFAAIAMREMELWRDKIQLRIRDRIQTSMEEFSRECLEIDAETDEPEHADLITGSSMDRVYDRAAKLVKRTLDVEGVIVMDVSHCEVLEHMNGDGNVLVTIHHGDQGQEMTQQQLTTNEYRRLHAFFEKHPQGRISEGIIPSSFKPFLPTHVQYALTVPIFNVDKRPFALLCAYNVQEHKKRFLEGHELSYLRAIGVIILSAVLKRRMLLADKAKGLFISNISHELRTPLHGILAAAELLSESPLNHVQASFLQTVQACGTSLVETVNHVLDFTKLSGNSKAVHDSAIVATTVDMMQLVEEAVDGSWIGHCARIAIADESGIGSVYSPPKQDQGLQRADHVETVVDIGYRSEGWPFKFEKGGIRRVLMNLFGNSLKYTSNGYIHVRLRELPPSEDDPPNRVKVELAVIDTGKGISQDFLKNQLFHPFSQENPLQTGTGLGLAIVSSIVTSDVIGGKVDVWSEEGVGTEIKVTFSAELPTVGPELHAPEMEPFFRPGDVNARTISLVGFSSSHRGVQLLRDVLRTYLTIWWGFTIVDDGDIVIVNDDPSVIVAATERRDISKCFIILSAARGNPEIMAITSEHERIGGFCRMLSKPGGPSRLRAILKLSLHALSIAKCSTDMSVQSLAVSTGDGSVGSNPSDAAQAPHPPRRNSEEPPQPKPPAMKRPGISRSSTANPTVQGRQWRLPPMEEKQEVLDPEAPVPALSIGHGGTLLKSSVGTVDVETRSRVLVVEDNSILRNLLIRWLSAKNYDFRSAVDGVDGVNTYQKEGPFDVVLLDMSMPNLNGVGATEQIRRIEADLANMTSDFRPTRILALTGMSSLEDKRRAFEAGVDGYLVKPVAFKTLDEMFHKLGLSQH